MITIRPIRASEGERLRAIRLAALLDTPAAFATTHAEALGFPLELWAGRAAEGAVGEQTITFFAEAEDGALVGMVAGLRGETPTVELVSMWTAQAARGAGVASALVAAVVEWASSSPVELWLTRGNEAAVALYEQCGFVLTDDFQPLPSDPCKDEMRMRRVPGA